MMHDIIILVMWLYFLNNGINKQFIKRELSVIL